jgi:hypothetical protein
MLVTPFEKTEAFRLGVIDKDGSLLVKVKDQNANQKAAYDYLDRMVFNLKRLLAKLPGGKSMLGSMIAAVYLIREDRNLTKSELEEKFISILEKIEQNKVTLVEEELCVEEFLSLFEEGAPANVSGPSVSTDAPAIRAGKKGRKFGTFDVEPEVLRRFAKGKKKFTKWSEYLNLEDPKQSEVYKYAKKNPKGVLILRAGEQTRAIRYNRNGGGKWHKLQRNRKSSVIETEVM